MVDRTKPKGSTRAGTAPLAVRYVPVDSLKPYAKNARTHSPAQLEQLKRSIREFGWTNPLLVDDKGGLIAGHGRLQAAIEDGWERVPVITLSGLTQVQRRALVLADNKLALNAGWDDVLLTSELQALGAAGFATTLVGFSENELQRLFASAEDDGAADVSPPPPKVPRSSFGDVWICGRHRVMCGDSTSPEHVRQLIGDAGAVHLVHADPPYGMGKERDGVANDNLYAAKLDAFQMKWWAACRPTLASNASAYLWGNAPDLWRLWWRGGLADSEPLTVRNEIVWDKIAIPGMASPELTQFPEATERCLFFQLGRFVFLIGQTKDDYWQGWEPIRQWLCEQRDAAGFKPADVKRICGNHMYGHWFSQSQWVIISEENYAKLAEAAGGKAFTRPYADLRKVYNDAYAVYCGTVRDDRRSDFDAARPFFNNAHDSMYDVWQFPRVTGEEREGHATPKPVAMVERAIKSSSRAGELVLAPFSGSGTDLIAAERTDRRCAAMELIPAWTDVTVQRWQLLTGQAAVHAVTGKPFGS